MFNFSQSVREPTHDIGHLLDLVFYKSSDNIYLSTVLHHELTSDHTSVLCKFDISKPPPEANIIQYRCLSKTNPLSFKQDLSDLVDPPKRRITLLRFCPAQLVNNYSKTSTPSSVNALPRPFLQSLTTCKLSFLSTLLTRFVLSGTAFLTQIQQLSLTVLLDLLETLSWLLHPSLISPS